MAVAVVAALAPAPARADQAFRWLQGQPSVPMAPAAAFHCYLTRVGGKFRGYGEQVRIRVVDRVWRLEGNSRQEGVNAIARCFARATIKVPAGAVRSSGTEVSATADNDGAGCVDTAPRRAGPPGAAANITLVTGALRGGGEHVSVDQMPGAAGAPGLIVHSCQKELAVGVHSLFFGKPGGGSAARFIGPNGIGTASRAGEYISVLNRDVPLAPIGEAICYFSVIGGEFNGGGESVTIAPGADAHGVRRWMLRARHRSGTGVWAKARCYARDQR